MEQITVRINPYDGGLSRETVNGVRHQAELKKLKAHYGIRATLKSYEQAAWDKEGAYFRLDPCNELWLRIEATKDIIGADFAMKVHILLAESCTAEDVVETLGSFEDYLHDELYWEGATLLRGTQIINALRKPKNVGGLSIESNAVLWRAGRSCGALSAAN